MGNEKLVRDKIPEIIQSKGVQPKVRKAQKEELDALLRDKIVEEAIELQISSDSEEIVDILEAIDALIEHRVLDKGLLELQQHAKRLARGGFTEGYVVDMDIFED
ncbi:MAG: nucleoside triphosphate pyrophosphohydrolase [Candidatus Thorarchaeota archaeon]